MRDNECLDLALTNLIHQRKEFLTLEIESTPDFLNELNVR